MIGPCRFTVRILSAASNLLDPKSANSGRIATASAEKVRSGTLRNLEQAKLRKEINSLFVGWFVCLHLHLCLLVDLILKRKLYIRLFVVWFA